MRYVPQKREVSRVPEDWMVKALVSGTTQYPSVAPIPEDQNQVDRTLDMAKQSSKGQVI